MSAPKVSAGRVAGIAQLLSQAEHAVTARVQRTLHGGLTIEQWRVLVLLSDAEGHRMSEIAEFAMVPPPTLTKIIDRMVESNMVYRRVDIADRRRVLVFLTARGRDAYRRNASRVEREQRQLLAALGALEAARLAELLHQITWAYPDGRARPLADRGRRPPADSTRPEPLDVPS